MKKAKLLLVEDDLQSRKSTEKILVIEGYEVEVAENGLQAIERLKNGKDGISLVLSDLRMPEMDGIEFLKALSVLGSDLPVILMTAYGKVDDAVWAMKWGVVDFLSKPFKRQALLEAVETGLKRVNAKSLNASVAGAATKPGVVRESTWLGISPVFRALSDEVDRVAATQATVLITGESGSGKEQVARELHRRSARKSQPFIVINCAALPENLLESELFGVEKGAYTGADSSRIGLFEAAHGGTLFLDEIGEMSLSLQAKMLRVLQDGEIRRVGSVSSKRVNVRLITATNRDLRERVASGYFREDLLYRLEVVYLRVPSLRERGEDLPELALHFLRQFALKHEKPVYGMEDRFLEAILSYSWPGNVRELQNAIERAVVFSEGDELTRDSLPESIRAALAAGSGIPATSDRNLSIAIGTPLKEVEDLMIRKTLEHSQGDKELTAKLLGINSRTIYRRLQEKNSDEPV